MRITIGLFLEFRPSLHIFSSDAILKIVKNRNSYFGLLSLSRMASLLFGPGKGMAESVILSSSYQKNLTAFALLTRLLSKKGRHLGLECYGFCNSRIARFLQEKKL